MADISYDYNEPIQQFRENEQTDENYKSKDYEKIDQEKKPMKEKFFGFSHKQKKIISTIAYYVIKYLRYYFGRLLVPYFTFLSFFVRMFVAQKNMSHEKFLGNIETDRKHVFHYLINPQTRLSDDEVKKLNREKLIEFVLTQYTCRQRTLKYNNNDYSYLNENVIFSDPMLVLKNKIEFQMVFDILPIIFQCNLREDTLKITHYKKCIVISFDVDWIVLQNRLKLKPQLLIVALRGINDTKSDQENMQYIYDANVLNENLKKDELTFYKTFETNDNVGKQNKNSDIINQNMNIYPSNFVQPEENVGEPNEKQEEIIALYDFWMSDHHYSFFGYYKIIRRFMSFAMIIGSFILNFLTLQYNLFFNDQYGKKYE